MMKRLVVYYSLQGHTKRVAELIADKTGSDLLEIKAEKNYNLLTVAALGRTHIKNKHTPPIEPIRCDLDDYDEIILGTPVWWYTFVPHVRSFIKIYDLSGKSVRLFSTHGGANGTTFQDLRESIGKADYKGQQDFSGRGSVLEDAVNRWLQI